MTNKFLMIGNWKLNHTRATALSFFEELNKGLPKDLSIELGIAPTAPMLDFVGQRLRDMPVALVAQNVFWAQSGAFTGEWSAEQLVELGVKYCLIGHSERRSLFGETDELLLKKADHCLSSSLVPVFCVGESLSAYEADQSFDAVHKQLSPLLPMLKKRAPEQFVLAYEPIWAIGTGHHAKPQVISRMHEFIRDVLSKNLDLGLVQRFRILYGGSVSADNIKQIGDLPSVDGVLVGGASLQAYSFLSMVKALM